MFWLAIKTLVYRRGRFVITVSGVIFSSVLALIQMAVYLGSMGNATNVIRNTDADVWITSRNIQNFDFASLFDEERVNRVKSLPNVAAADKILTAWGFLKLQNGSQEQVQIIGFNPDSGAGGPWSMLKGDPIDVKGGSYIILDADSEQRLGKLEVGSIWELSGRRVKLVALSSGIKTFSTAPLVFMSYDRAQQFFTDHDQPKQTAFITVKLKDPRNADQTVARLRSIMSNNDVFTRNDFVVKTVIYWTIQTGIGMALFLTAFLGLLVGGAIVGQTTYANTMEQLPEFGTLKAMGARNRDLYTIVFSQTGACVLIGYGAASAIVLAARRTLEAAGATLFLDSPVFLVLFAVTLLICLLASFVSVSKIRNLDPVIVFRQG